MTTANSVIHQTLRPFPGLVQIGVPEPSHANASESLSEPVLMLRQATLLDVASSGCMPFWRYQSLQPDRHPAIGPLTCIS